LQVAGEGKSDSGIFRGR